MDLIKIRMQALEDGYFYYTTRKKFLQLKSKPALSDLEQFLLDNNASIEERERILREVSTNQFDIDSRKREELREQDYLDQLRDEQWAEQHYSRSDALQEQILEADLYRIGY